MKKKILATVAFILVFAVGCSTETQEQREERNARISKNAQELEKGLKEMVELLERGPGPTTEATEK